MTIRLARTDDAPAILALEAQFPGDRLSPQSVRRLLRSASARVWVAEHGGEVLGNLVLLVPQRTRHARIYSVVVAPQARGRGLAAALLAAAETEARALGRLRMTLEVRADNEAARALYTRCGYRCVARRPGYYDDGADGEAWHKSLQ